jgi:two-component system chemotaxis response regulator CheY
MRRVVRRVLDLSGVDVGSHFEAEGGSEALTVLHAEWIDLILTDINMPSMDGEQLVAEVRQDPSIQSIPILVVSTDQSETRMRKMMELGANGYVAKPFSPAILSQEINRLLGGASYVDTF